MASQFGKSLTCPNCKRPVPEGASVCPNCGKTFGISEGSANHLTGSEEKDKQTGVGIAILSSSVLTGLAIAIARTAAASWKGYGPTYLAAALVFIPTLAMYAFLRVRYPVVGRYYGRTSLIVLIVVPVVLTLGALAICAVILGACSSKL